MDTLLFWVGGLEALALVSLVVSGFVQWLTASRLRPHAELQTALLELEQQFADLTDHLTRKESRERVRKMRDGREAQLTLTAPIVPPVGTVEYKQWLRKQAGISRAP
jgi:hypothetical protein